MSNFRLSIGTHNAAFADGNRDAELARILRHLADRLDNGEIDNGAVQIRDINGNTVGELRPGPLRP